MTLNEIRVTLRGMNSASKDLLFAQKPSGYHTQAPDIGKKGLREVLSERQGHELFSVHRLEQDTCGAIVFALSQRVATEVSSLFEKNQIARTYFF
ncbi:MAG: hypothetical protein EOP06_19255, partial [Proteobacteria bacterium]